MAISKGYIRPKSEFEKSIRKADIGNSCFNCSFSRFNDNKSKYHVKNQGNRIIVYCTRWNEKASNTLKWSKNIGCDKFVVS